MNGKKNFDIFNIKNNKKCFTNDKCSTSKTVDFVVQNDTLNNFNNQGKYTIF